MGIAVLPFAAYFDSILTFRSGRRTLARVLSRYLSGKALPHLEQILRDIKFLQEEAPWEDTERLRHFLDKAQDCHDSATEYLSQIERHNPGFFWNLLRAYLAKSPEFRDLAESTKEEDIRDIELNNKKRWRSEQVNLMFDNITHYVAFMKKEGFDQPDLVEEAWITLIFRGMCWGICHEADRPGDDNLGFLPAKYYGSQMPIYLT